MIKRKTLIYKTGVEYGDYTLNHVQGCSHGCKYPCYAYMMAKRFGKVKNYEEWIQPQIVENTAENLAPDGQKAALRAGYQPFPQGFQHVETAFPRLRFV